MRGRRPCGLSRLRQTQEGVRERAQWAVSQGEPSSGVPPWKCAKAHFQKGYHQSLLKPAPSARRPLAEAAAVFQSWVPPRPLQRLPPPAYAPLALLFFHRLRRLRPWSSAPHLAAFEKAGKTFTFLSQTQARAACQPPSENPAALKRRARHVQSGHGRLERGKWTNHPENPGNKPFL